MSRTAARSAVPLLASLLALLVPLTPLRAAQSWVLDLASGSGSVEFRATGKPSMIRISGKGPSQRGRFTIRGRSVAGTAQVDVKAFTTGMKLRDQHLHQKYLRSEEFPVATLTVTELTLPETFESGAFDADVPFKGTLKIRDKENPVEGSARVLRDGEKIRIETAFDILLSRYGIGIPTFLDITVAEQVKVETRFAGNLAPAPMQ